MTKFRLRKPTGANKDTEKIVQDINSLHDFNNYSYAHRHFQKQMLAAVVDFNNTAFQTSSDRKTIFSAAVFPKGGCIINAYAYCDSSVTALTGTISFFLGDRTSAFLAASFSGDSTNIGIGVSGHIVAWSGNITTAGVGYFCTTAACDIYVQTNTAQTTGMFKIFVEYLPVAGN